MYLRIILLKEISFTMQNSWKDIPANYLNPGIKDKISSWFRQKNTVFVGTNKECADVIIQTAISKWKLKFLTMLETLTKFMVIWIVISRNSETRRWKFLFCFCEILLVFKNLSDTQVKLSKQKRRNRFAVLGLGLDSLIFSFKETAFQTAFRYHYWNLQFALER